jgi:hypothetical protein
VVVPTTPAELTELTEEGTPGPLPELVTPPTLPGAAAMLPPELPAGEELPLVVPTAAVFALEVAAGELAPALPAAPTVLPPAVPLGPPEFPVDVPALAPGLAEAEPELAPVLPEEAALPAAPPFCARAGTAANDMARKDAVKIRVIIDRSIEG